MKAYVTGGTGFVGRALLRELLARGVTPRLLVRPGSEAKLGELRGQVETVAGDPLKEEDHLRGLEDCGACIHLIGIIRESPRKGATYDRLHVKAVDVLVSALKEANVSRLVHMSALGTRADAPSGYHASKWKGERIVRYSGLSWTVLRPSVILGPEGAFTRMLERLARASLVPLPGGGDSLFQPVGVETVACALAQAVLDPKDSFEGKTYEVGGGENRSLREMVGMFAKALGRRTPAFLSVPMGPLSLVTALLGWLPSYPVTRDQLTMLREGSVPQDSQPFFRDFGVTPVPLERLIGHCVGKTTP